MRVILGTLLLILFSFQVVPVKGLGKLLAKMQNTEEVQGDDVPSTDDTGDGLCIKELKFSESGFYTNADQTVQRYWRIVKSGSNKFPVRHVELISLHIDDIPSPPPDIFPLLGC